MSSPSIPNLEQRLTTTKDQLEQFQAEAHKQGNKLSKDILEKLITQLNGIGDELDRLNQGITSAKLEKQHSAAMTALINQTLAIVISIRQDKNIREKVNALQALMFANSFNSSLEKFQARLQNLKQLKRGERVANIELDQQGQ